MLNVNEEKRVIEKNIQNATDEIIRLKEVIKEEKKKLKKVEKIKKELEKIFGENENSETTEDDENLHPVESCDNF